MGPTQRRVRSSDRLADGSRPRGTFQHPVVENRFDSRSLERRKTPISRCLEKCEVCHPMKTAKGNANFLYVPKCKRAYSNPFFSTPFCGHYPERNRSPSLRSGRQGWVPDSHPNLSGRGKSLPPSNFCARLVIVPSISQWSSSFPPSNPHPFMRSPKMTSNANFIQRSSGKHLLAGG